MFLGTYRVYRLDGAGKISSAEWIEALDDEDARLKAKDQLDGASYELWDRNRLIVRVGRQQH
jgi:hypothetical protein